MKISITQKELDALFNLVDLASQSISDAEYDHLDKTKRTRRNGGYSMDLRIGNRALSKLQKKINRGEK